MIVTRLNIRDDVATRGAILGLHANLQRLQDDPSEYMVDRDQQKPKLVAARVDHVQETYGELEIGVSEGSQCS